MSSLINAGTAGERRGTADGIGKINCRLPGARSISSPAETGPRDIEQRYTLFALAINQRSRPLRYQTLRESNSFARSARPLGTSLHLAKKKEEKLSHSLLVEQQRENSVAEKLREALLKALETHLRISGLSGGILLR